MIKKSIITTIFISILSGIMYGQNLTALDIMRKVDKASWSNSSKITMTQTILTTSGAKRALDMISYSKDGNNKTLYRYTGPARVAGMSFLMLDGGNDIWAYFPKTDRVRHLASHVKNQKMMGSDFSYEDMGAAKLENDYTGKLLGSEEIEGKNCYKLELTPTETGPQYSKVLLWADKENFVEHRIDYYDKDGVLLKRLIQTDIKNIQGHLTPYKYTMTNIQDEGVTTIELKEVKYDINLNDDYFTTYNLKKR